MSAGKSGMESRRHTLTALSIFLIVFFFNAPDFLFDLKIQDFLFFLRGPLKNAANNIILVAIDDRSLKNATYGNWPWRRRAYADLLKVLHSFKPSVIAFDIAFLEPSQVFPNDDREFAERCRAAGNVFLASYLFRAAGAESEDIGEMRGMGPPSQLSESAAGVGFVNSVYDYDNMVRRTKLFHVSSFDRAKSGKPKIDFALSIQIICRHLGFTLGEIEISPNTLEFKSPFKQIVVPLDAKKHMKINYAGYPDELPRVSFCDVLAKKVSSELFHDKIVLVGPPLKF